METQIWKYTLSPDQLIQIMPNGAKVLYVAEQHGDICIWAEVNPANPPSTRTFEIYETGQPIHYDIGVNHKHLGSVKLTNSALIYHIYEAVR